MIKIPIADFKTFFHLSAGIKPNALHPALNVIHMDVDNNVCTLTKTNMNSYVQCNFEITPCIDCTLLLDDKIMHAFPTSQKKRASVVGILMNTQTISKTSQLNPRFVAEMMRFPTNWTELPFQNGEIKV